LADRRGKVPFASGGRAHGHEPGGPVAVGRHGLPRGPRDPRGAHRLLPVARPAAEV